MKFLNTHLGTILIVIGLFFLILLTVIDSRGDMIKMGLLGIAFSIVIFSGAYLLKDKK